MPKKKEKPWVTTYKGEVTKNSDRYLALYEQFGPTRSTAELLRMAGVSRNAIYNWRYSLGKFKEREQAIREKWERNEIIAAKGVETVGIDLATGLDTIEAGFIDLYRTTQDRVGSATAMGVSWAFIKRRIKDNPNLRVAYEAVLEATVAANEDTILRRGATGDVTAAKVTVKAHMPERYGDRVEVNQHTSVDVRITGDETIRELGSWIKRFGRLQPAGEFRRERLLEDGEAEVVEAEAVAV